jgi:hypothetical protein
MKKILLCVMVAGFMTTTTEAQTILNPRKGGIGIRAGVNFQNLNGKDAAGNDLKNDMTTGFHAGLTADLPLGSNSFLQPGVLYSRKGAEMMNGDKVKLNYVEVPLSLVYKPALGTGNMILGFGPYVAFGIGGKVEENNGASRDIVFTKNQDIANTAPQFQRFDAGGNLMAGYEFANRLSFQLNAQLGVVDVNPKPAVTNDQTRMRNTGFGLSLGYRF